MHDVATVYTRSVINEPDSDPAGETGSLDPFFGESFLLCGKGDGVDRAASGSDSLDEILG